MEQETPQETQETPNHKPCLWNPAMAAFWSLFFTPAFGAYLHALNWKELGEAKKARDSMNWAYGAVGFILLWALSLPNNNLTLIGLIPGSIIFLVAWYFVMASTQVAFVKEKLDNNYDKKDWEKPIGFASTTLIAIMIGFPMLVSSSDTKSVDKDRGQSSSATKDMNRGQSSGAAKAMDKYSGEASALANGQIYIKGFYLGMSATEAINVIERMGYTAELSPTPENVQVDENEKIETPLRPKKIIRPERIEIEEMTQWGAFSRLTLTLDGSQNVSEIGMRGDIVDEMFNTHDMPAEEFVQNFIDAHSIPEMHSTTKYRIDYFGDTVSETSWAYIDRHNGWKITIDDDKRIVLERITRASETNF
jgi:hypothetical protein